MKTRAQERGSALLLVAVVVLLLMGIGSAFLTETLWRGRAQFRAIESDEAQVICDAALDRARVALLRCRNADPSAWNTVLERCQPTLAAWTPAAIRTDYQSRIGQPPFSTYDPSRDSSIPALSGTGAALVEPLFSGDDTGTAAVFNQNVPFRKGAYFMTVRDNEDVHGNGLDDNEDGDVWDADTPAEVSAELTSATVDGDRHVYVIVTATLRDGVQRQIEALLRYPTARWTPPAALLTGGSLAMKGAFSILGTRGLVHSNEDLQGNGGANASVSVSVNAAGSASGFSMNNPPPGGINDGSDNPPVSSAGIPAVDPGLYRNDPNLTPNMIVLDRHGNVTDAWGGSPPPGNYPFSYSGGTWSISGSGSATSAIYYVEGDFKMTGQGSSSPYVMTIIADGSITLGGNSSFQAFVDPVTGRSNNVLAIAGGDLTLTGTGSSGSAQYQGVAMAHEQVLIKGNYKIHGAVIGENAVDQSASVSSSNSVEDTLLGSVTITYDGLTTFVREAQQFVNVMSLRRLK